VRLAQVGRQARGIDRETVVLAGDQDPPRIHVDHRAYNGENYSLYIDGTVPAGTGISGYDKYVGFEQINNAYEVFGNNRSRIGLLGSLDWYIQAGKGSHALKFGIAGCSIDAVLHGVTLPPEATQTAANRRRRKEGARAPGAIADITRRRRCDNLGHGRCG